MGSLRHKMVQSKATYSRNCLGLEKLLYLTKKLFLSNLKVNKSKDQKNNICHSPLVGDIS